MPHILEHFIMFGITGIAFGIGYSSTSNLVAFSLVVFAGAIELLQTLVPSRHARWSDFIIDAVAVFLGVIVGSMVQGIGNRRFDQIPKVVKKSGMQ